MMFILFLRLVCPTVPEKLLPLSGAASSFPSLQGSLGPEPVSLALQSQSLTCELPPPLFCLVIIPALSPGALVAIPMVIGPAIGEQAYTALLEDQLKPLIVQGLCAGIYTQVTDVETEVNGLMTYDREMVKLSKPLKIYK